ncbi:MAG: ABC transporter ATP-binding protein [Gammaproteobacteria bacterium]|nr:ABC transporter ATP-binding protein [Gammaproteobacteria bacterium]
MIETTNLIKLYRTEAIETSALNGVSLRIDDGEFVAIMGPSGCGKSTLLHVLGLIDAPTEGDYRFLDHAVAGWNERRRALLRKANIGFVFQSFNLLDELTVAENIELALQYNDVPAIERKPRVDEVLERMNIAHRRNHFPQQLSGGQQQRVAVARAVVNRPRLILADEPTGNLDTEHGTAVMKLLKQLNEAGTTIVMVTHSEENAAWGSRIVRMLDGKVLSHDTPKGRFASLQ